MDETSAAIEALLLRIDAKVLEVETELRRREMLRDKIVERQIDEVRMGMGEDRPHGHYMSYAEPRRRQAPLREQYAPLVEQAVRSYDEYASGILKVYERP
jgi:hypothetical protein